jgi:hypothetical protein
MEHSGKQLYNIFYSMFQYFSFETSRIVLYGITVSQHCMVYFSSTVNSSDKNFTLQKIINNIFVAFNYIYCLLQHMCKYRKNV